MFIGIAVDGLDALEKLRQQEFGAVLSDLEMPRMNGFELLAEMRKDERLQNIPVFVVTSRDAAKHRARAEHEGASGYITKPFTQEQLLEKLKPLLGDPKNEPSPEE